MQIKYLISDTKNNVINSQKLISEFNLSNLSVKISDEGIQTDSESLIINFTFELSNEDTNILDDIIKTHDGTIYNIKLTNNTDTNILENIDYDIRGLHKERIIVKGELIEINYYKNYDFKFKAYDDLFVKETRKYIRDTVTGLLGYRLMSGFWYDTNNQIVHKIENVIKYYTFDQQREELQTRRRNIIAEAERYLLFFLMSQYGQQDGLRKSLEFLSGAKLDKELYIDGIGKDLIDLINSSDKDYFTDEIKKNLIVILSY